MEEIEELRTELNTLIANITQHKEKINEKLITFKSEVKEERATFKYILAKEIDSTTDKKVEKLEKSLKELISARVKVVGIITGLLVTMLTGLAVYTTTTSARVDSFKDNVRIEISTLKSEISNSLNEIIVKQVELSVLMRSHNKSHDRERNDDILKTRKK